jgi:hypothetical protein
MNYLRLETRIGGLVEIFANVSFSAYVDLTNFQKSRRASGIR